MDEGFSAYVTKPIREEVLLSTLKKFLPKELIKPIEAKTEEPEKKPNACEATKEQAKATATMSDYLDKATGLAYCMNDENFYNEMLDEYANSDKTKDLNESLNKADFENYRITVHAVKSSSLTIGAIKVSEDAKALEMACKENNLDYVKQNHKAFMDEYTTLLEVLKKKIICSSTY
jgi:HPt (histidine-containing phosphotransfer) domain-containing protein